MKQLYPEFEQVLASWPKTIALEIDGVGNVLCCHSTPRSETEIFIPSIPEDRLLPIFEILNMDVIVCGHSHMQFDRMIGKTRVVNAGSVGESYRTPGADWLLLGPDVELMHTLYDFTKAAERIRDTSFPNSEEFAKDILQPPSAEEMLELFRKAHLTK